LGLQNGVHYQAGGRYLEVSSGLTVVFCYNQKRTFSIFSFLFLYTKKTLKRKLVDHSFVAYQIGKIVSQCYKRNLVLKAKNSSTVNCIKSD